MLIQVFHSFTYHNCNFPFTNVEVCRVIDIHSLQCITVSTMRPHQENSGEATYENKYQLNIKNLKLLLKLCNIIEELNLRGK